MASAASELSAAVTAEAGIAQAAGELRASIGSEIELVEAGQARHYQESIDAWVVDFTSKARAETEKLRSELAVEV